jgi:ribose transport system permease protein
MTDAPLPAPGRRFRFERHASTILLLAAVTIYIALIVIMGQTRFLTLAILGRSITLGITAIGQTFAILVASIDLSVASLISAAAVVTSVVMNGDPAMMLPAVLAVLALGVVVGLVNGLVITKLEVNPLIATLGMSLIIQGVLSYYYNNFAGNVPVEFQIFAYGSLGIVPFSLVFMFVLAGCAWFVLRFTRFGCGAACRHQDRPRRHRRARDLLALRRHCRHLPRLAFAVRRAMDRG